MNVFVSLVKFFIKAITEIVWAALWLIAGILGGMILMAIVITDGGLDSQLFDQLVKSGFLKRNRSGAWVKSF